MTVKLKNSILETRNLTIGYQQKKQLTVVANNINLTLAKGKLISILGKNGIGKSTFLRTVSKVQNPIDGEVYINGKNVNDLQNNELAKTISLVLTERLPESQLTVYEIIALGRQPYTNWIDNLSEYDINQINKAIQQTKINHLKDKRFYELSDGQLQRVLIARALAQDTSIIILDEPTAHLDLHSTIQIISLLKDLVTNTNKTIIMSTHQVNLAIQLSDTIVLFKENSVTSGTPKDLINNDYFKDLFPSKLVEFNKDLQQFVINKK